MTRPGIRSQVAWTIALAVALFVGVGGYVVVVRPALRIPARMSTIDARMSALASEQRLQAKNMDELAAACVSMSDNAVKTAQEVNELARRMVERSYPDPLRKLYFGDRAKEKKP